MIGIGISLNRKMYKKFVYIFVWGIQFIVITINIKTNLFQLII